MTQLLIIEGFTGQNPNASITYQRQDVGDQSMILTALENELRGYNQWSFRCGINAGRGIWAQVGELEGVAADDASSPEGQETFEIQKVLVAFVTEHFSKNEDGTDPWNAPRESDGTEDMIFW